MPKEQRKRGRREEKKRKRQEEEEIDELPKRQKSQNAEEQVGNYGEGFVEQEERVPYVGPGELPFYGLLDEDEQEYFKRADSMLELNQFADPGERDLFLANVYKEASGKELKIANSQSCSRLMERLVLLSTPTQLKTLFQKFSGHFLHLVQHRFASHCCEALFLKAAPLVTSELTGPLDEEKQGQDDGEVYVSMESLFLYTLNELEGNLGYLMTDQFASHPLRVLLVVLSGMPLTTANSTSLMQSKRKENITVSAGSAVAKEAGTAIRHVPDAFHEAIDKMTAATVAGLDTTNLRALATHPIANPVLQLLLELELTRSGKQSAKDPNSIFRKLIPDDALAEGTESASFINSLSYDTIGSRLLEVIVTHAPGKTFKAFYRSYFGDKIGTLARNEIAAFVVIKVIERLNKDDLQTAVDQICPHMTLLVERSRTSIIKVLIERCRVRQLDTQAISNGLREAYGEEASERLIKMLKVSAAPADGMAEDRRKRLDAQDSSKTHGSLLAQCMLGSPGPLREYITEGLITIQTTILMNIAKDRAASRVLQSSLICSADTQKFRRGFIPRFYGHMGDLAIDTVASHVIDSLWEASAGLTFIRERVADELAQNESVLRTSVPGRAVWRNWKMDIYKTRRKEWVNDMKDQESRVKTSLELARERFAVNKTTRKKPSKLLNAVQDRIIPFIRSADEDTSTKQTGHGLSISGGGPRTSLVEHHKPQKLAQLMNLSLPETGKAKDGFLKAVEQILQYSVNTWDRGFLSKLYASTDAPGLSAELLTAALNTNVHTYEVSPALTLIEKHTTRALANLFGLNGPHAGGISVQGGSISNTTSIVVARNTLYPDTKEHGNASKNRKLILFTSAHGHYSIEKAAQMLGFGSSSVWSVPVDPKTGSMDPEAFKTLVHKATEEGYTPFYLNATAGTTVLGSYDPFQPLSEICKEHNIWLHIDASWGGPAIFSPTHKHKLKGSEQADSLAINPHKMMGVPITCSFLLAADLRQFHASNTLPASYLFHSNPSSSSGEVYDLADLTLQCGRRGDSLKLYLSWIYHGTEGYANQIDAAFDTAAYLATLVAEHEDLVLVGALPPPCCQVCFFYARGGKLRGRGEDNGQVTREIAGGLVPRGFMVDYAGVDERGAFLRVVVGRETGRGTVEGLVEAVVDLGRKAWGDGE